MIKTVLISIIVLFASFVLSAQVLTSTNSKPSSLNRTVDANDSVIFDLSNAIVTSTYIDIPVFIKSNDVINALDFELKFNETKLTYDSIIIYRSYLSGLAYFNLSDRFLRFTSSSLTTIDNDSILIAIRFVLPNACTQINSSDFNTITVYLNGDPCSYRVTNSSQYMPLADFANTAICSGTNVIFTDATFISGGFINSWLWDFGDGSVSTLQNPTTNYVTSGSYIVELIVTSNSGCTDTITKPVVVNSSPVASFTYALNTTMDTASFTNTSSIPFGTIINWDWDFGDGNFSTIQNPIHDYTSPGTYIVTLTSVSDSGCVNNFSDTLYISAAGITAISNDNFVTCYPNPSSGILYVTVSEDVTAAVTDILGKVILLQANVVANNIQKINLENISNGVYLLKVYNRNFISTKKIIINK